MQDVARPDDSAERRYPVEFTASAGEYFRIWIVNLALTIVTLGIYSAWAKVRKRRYFYGHTRIAGEAFEYTSACPLATQIGSMHGSYRMVTDGGETFDARIAPFTLAIPGVLN